MNHETLDPFIATHIGHAFRLYTHIRAFHDDHPGETTLVLMEGALDGLKQALTERLAYYMAAKIHQADQRGPA